MTQTSKTEDDTIDLKSSFFSGCSMENYRSLHHIKFNLCLTLYSHHTFHIFYGCISSSRRWQKCTSPCITRRTQRSLWWSWSKIACRCRDWDLKFADGVRAKWLMTSIWTSVFKIKIIASLKNYSLQKKANWNLMAKVLVIAPSKIIFS